MGKVLDRDAVIFLVFLEPFDEPHRVDGFGDEFELIALAYAALENF